MRGSRASGSPCTGGDPLGECPRVGCFQLGLRGHRDRPPGTLPALADFSGEVSETTGLAGPDLVEQTPALPRTLYYRIER